MTDQSAVGILANIKHESNFDTNAFCMIQTISRHTASASGTALVMRALFHSAKAMDMTIQVLTGQLAFMES